MQSFIRHSKQPDVGRHLAVFVMKSVLLPFRDVRLRGRAEGKWFLYEDDVR